jgi:hypothetical protein
MLEVCNIIAQPEMSMETFDRWQYWLTQQDTCGIDICPIKEEKD